MKLSQHVARTDLAIAAAFTAQMAPITKPHKTVTPTHAYCLAPAPPDLNSPIGHPTTDGVHIRVSIQESATPHGRTRQIGGK